MNHMLGGRLSTGSNKIKIQRAIKIENMFDRIEASRSYHRNNHSPGVSARRLLTPKHMME